MFEEDAFDTSKHLNIFDKYARRTYFMDGLSVFEINGFAF